MDISKIVLELIKRTSTIQDSGVRLLLESAMKTESAISKNILTDILKNCSIAQKKSVPICQDTGSINFFVLKGDYSESELRESIGIAVDKATEKGFLRKNLVDPISEENLGNGPKIYFEEGEFEIRLLLKGGGSENFSAQYSLPNQSLGANRDLDGVKKCVLDAIVNAQGKACSPYFIGLCIGGQRDTGYLEAKKQLFRAPGERKIGELEKDLMDKINSLGIGPMGLGGKTTALDVFATSLPRHPACYFVSISLNCWALRRGKVTLQNGNPYYH
jgi:fumarate hydratase, class I